MISLSHLAGQWTAISELLDRAIALPAHERIEFVSGLQGDAAEYRETLLQLLSQSAPYETDDFLRTLPRLSGGAAPASLADVSRGELVGPYRLIQELGAGGMGTVWLAERADGSLKRKVALKLPRLAWGRGLAERMARERDILASLEHPHIARLYDAGVDQFGRPYLALEYVEGQPIDVYSRERRLSVRQRLDLMLQVFSAVAFAHSRLVVHRDLKPSNILVTADGQVRLLDFGIAKLMEAGSANETQLTQFAGRALTLDYASPEQIKGEPIGTASDVYSLGVVVYELLTGAKPYRLKRGSPAELEEAVTTADVPLASSMSSDDATRKALRGDIDAIVNKALKKATVERYLTVDALAEEVKRHFAGEPVHAAPDSLLYRLRKLILRNKTASVVLAMLAAALVGGAYAQAAVMLALAVGVGIALWQRNRAQDAAREARDQTAVAEQQRARAARVKDFLLHLLVKSDTDSGSTAQTTVGQLLCKASVDLDASLNLDDESMLELKAALGSALVSLGEPSEALKLLEPVVSHLSDSQKNSSLGLQATFRYGESLQACNKAEAITVLTDVAERARRTEATVIEVQAKQHLASALIDANRTRDALVVIQEAAVAAERLEPVEHAVLRSHVFSAVVNAMRSSYEPGVLPAARRAVAAAEAADQVGKVQRLVAALTLADAEVSEGDVGSGIRRYEELEKPILEALGTNHPLVAVFYSWMGNACLHWGMPDVAIEKFAASIAILRKSKGEGSPNEALTHLNIAQCYAARREFNLAVDRLASQEATLAKLGRPSALVARFLEESLLVALEQGLMPPDGLLDDRYWIEPPADEAARIPWTVRRLALNQISGNLAAVQSVRDARALIARAPVRANRWRESVFLSRIALDAQLHDEARLTLEPVISELELMQAPESPLLATVRTLLGRVKMAAGDAESALLLFAAAERTWQAMSNVVEVARVRALQALTRAKSDKIESERLSASARPVLAKSALPWDRTLLAQLDAAAMAASRVSSSD